MAFFGNMFGNKQDAQQKTQDSQQQQQNPAGGAPAGDPAATQQQQQVSGIDKHIDLWKNDTTAEQQNTGPQPVFNITPEKLSEIASAMDFSKQLPADLATKALQGDVTALTALINTAGQQAYKASLEANTKMINAAFAQRETSFKNEVLPGLIDQHTKARAIEDANPIFRHPAAQPMLEGLKSQIIAKFPNASASEVSKMAGDLLHDFATSINGGTPQQLQEAQRRQSAPAEMDWATFFTT